MLTEGEMEELQKAAVYGPPTGNNTYHKCLGRVYAYVTCG